VALAKRRMRSKAKRKELKLARGVSECERKQKASGRAADLTRGERGLAMALSATQQEDPTNSDTATIHCCQGPTSVAVGKGHPKRRGLRNNAAERTEKER
jgi:hypothetical protein